MSDAQPQRKRKRALLEVVQEDGNSKFARALGSVDSQTREKGLQALTTWLSKRNDISEQEFKRLWKGIFYCFWHADRAAFQTAFLYFSVFSDTMRREWFGIDRLRLDKFMMLVRKFTHALFEYLQAQNWNLDIVSRSMACLQQDVMLNTDSHPAAGLMYHLADVFAVELREVCRGAAPPAAVLEALLEPFCQVMAKTQRAPFLARLREGFFDVVIQEVASPSEKLPFRHLAVAKLADHLFQLGALPETKARNRQELYDTSKALEQAVKTRLRQQGKMQKPAASPADTAAPAPALTSGHSKKHKQQKQLTEGKDGRAALGAARTALSDVESALAKKKLLKKHKKAAAAAAAVQAEPPLTQQQSNKSEAAGVSQKQAVPQAATAQKQLNPEPKQHKKKQKLSAKANAAQGTAAPLAPASLKAAPMQFDAVTAAASDQDGAEVQQPAAKKRRVRFAMKRNLLMQIGGAVPPQEVRTPPGSRPKGSALKRSSLANGPQAQAGSGSGGKHRGRKAKNSADKPARAQAKLFF